MCDQLFSCGAPDPAVCFLWRRRVRGALLGLCLTLNPALAQAQSTPTIDPPRDTLPTLPTFIPPATQPGTVLPAVELPNATNSNDALNNQSVFVSSYRIVGNTVVADSDLLALTKSFTNRHVSSDEFATLRDQITQIYIDRGFVTSGAVIAPQSVDDGVLEISIVEGRLVDVQITMDGRLTASYLRERATRGLTSIVNVGSIEQQLQLLRQNERVKSIAATLIPGRERGESVLRLQVEEARPIQGYLEVSNYESPSVGAERVLIDFKHTNLSGRADRLGLNLRASKGLRGFEATYDRPINAEDTLFDLRVQRSRSKIIEDSFADLDVVSESQTYGVGLRRTLKRDLKTHFNLHFAGEIRRSTSFLLGTPFSFTNAVENGRAKVTVLRFGQQLIRRDRRDAVSATSAFSLGLNAFDATENTGDLADGQFLSWRGDAYAARRFDTSRNMTLALRTSMQLTNSTLLGLEKFALGGHATVRGYRENTLVADNGVIASLELQVPIIQRGGRPRLELRPFVDAGYGWNYNDSSNGKTLWSLGLGLNWAITQRIHFDGFWARSMRQLDDVSDDDRDELQARIFTTFY